PRGQHAGADAACSKVVGGNRARELTGSDGAGDVSGPNRVRRGVNNLAWDEVCEWPIAVAGSHRDVQEAWAAIEHGAPEVQRGGEKTIGDALIVDHERAALLSAAAGSIEQA